MKNKNFLFTSLSKIVAITLLFINCKHGGEVISPISSVPVTVNDVKSSTTMTDVEGNVYETIVIGKQEWMVENLKTKHFRNNIEIPNKTGDPTWGTLTSSAFSDHSTLDTGYGKLYNWFAVTDSNNIAPLGWHVPTDADWSKLSDFLGGADVAGSKLKEKGNSHWKLNNIDASNSSGFSALPGGVKRDDGIFYDLEKIGYWWSASDAEANNGGSRIITNISGAITRKAINKTSGISVRCVSGDIPVLATTEPESITSFSANCGGSISFDGNLPILSKGVCWSTSPNPTISDSKTSDGTGTESYTSKLTKLEENTTYFIRAYATNEFGTSYGKEFRFKTVLMGLEIAGYSKDIVLFKHTDGRIFCTLSGDFSTFDRNGANKVCLYNFANNGYSGYNINNAILLPSGTVIVALTSYKENLKFLRSTNPSYTAWELVNDDWNGSMLYKGWTVNTKGVIIAGEYPTSSNILAVRLWKVSNDGKTWQVIHTFNGRQGTLTSQKQIFHIHTVGYDKYSGLFWIGTGDINKEPSVWTYNGTKMSLIGEGTQFWRQCSFVFTPDYVLWGTDGGVIIDNINKCRMVRYPKAGGSPEIVATTDCTLFNCEEIINNEMSTYLSCGTPNHIYLSNDGKNWRNVLNLALNPNQPNAYSWFYNFVDNGDGRMFGYATCILRADNGQPLTNGGTIILDLK